MGIDKLRLTLVEVNRSMNKDDAFYLHHQMKKQYLPSLTSKVENPLRIFNLLMKKKIVTPNNVQVISDAFNRMKRFGLASILNQVKKNKYSREVKKSFKSPSSNKTQDKGLPLTDQFILRLCTEEVGPNELMELGVKGFKLSIAAIRRAQFDHRSTLDASIAVFTEWKNQAPFPNATSWTPGETVPPFSMRGLGQALKDSNLNHTYRKYCM